jgi:hypothetical protein
MRTVWRVNRYLLSPKLSVNPGVRNSPVDQGDGEDDDRDVHDFRTPGG